MAKNSGKKTKTLSLGLIIVGLIFVYFAYHALTYIMKEKVSVYSVGEACSITTDDVFEGLILRSEELIPAASSGYINYFSAEGSRCSINDVIYSIDEDGSFNNILSSGKGTSGLTDENLASVSKDLSKFTLNYSGTKYNTVYSLKNSISYKLLGFLDTGSSQFLESLGINSNYFHTYTSDKPGITEYYTDGFETLTCEDVSLSDFEKENYKKNNFSSGARIGTGDTAYKLITSENWSIVIPLNDDQAEKYKDNSRVDVLFNETGIKTTVLFEEFKGADMNIYGLLTLSKYMIQYADSRFLTVTLINDNEKGIKIPVSALVESEFYVVPSECITEGGNTSSDGLFIETLTIDGSDVVFVPLDIFHEDKEAGKVYISKEQLEPGTLAINPATQERVAISQTGMLSGVYNVNKGYAVFKFLDIISSNDEYIMAKSGVKYSISAFDNILLNAANGYEGMKIY